MILQIINFQYEGKQTCDNTWVYGYPYSDGKKSYIAYEGKNDCVIHEIISDTITRYIGLKDKNNKKIFEGDICQNGERIYLICWLSSQYTWGCYNLKTGRKTPIYQVISHEGNNFEVIDNKFDNPDWRNL